MCVRIQARKDETRVKSNGKPLENPALDTKLATPICIKPPLLSITKAPPLSPWNITNSIVSKSYAGLIWIYLYSQFQTNIWDALKGCDYITQNMLLSHEFLHTVMSISGVALQARIWSVQFCCFKVNVLCKEVTKKDWNKGAWIIVRWSGCGGKKLGNWTSGGLSMSGDCSVLLFQKASREFVCYWYYVLGTGSSVFSVVLFCASFLNKILNLRSFTACLFSFNPWITEQKTYYFYRTGYIFTHIFKIIFSTFFSRFD